MLPMQVRGAVRRAMHEYADYFGFGSGEVIIEPTAPEQVLRDMLAEVDRREPAAAVMTRLHQVARSWDIDLRRVFDADSPRTQALWKIMDAIEGAAGGHLIVPSRQHLTSLGPSGQAVLQRFTRTTNADLYFLEPVDRDLLAPLTDSEDARFPEIRQGERVLVESRVGAIPAVARLDALYELSRRGWPEMMAPVDALYLALVNDAVAAAEAVGVVAFGPGGADGVIRLLQRDDGLLVVELDESRPRVDEPSPALSALCAQADRYTEQGRTFTRCTLASELSPESTALSVGCRGER
ncbi:hypothetical protein [Nocardia bhagyanarayanae]|uniref:hypothetical protein n=1 Tax=Nocardia bhagyanarayanae TaxID=1215925 RepID=UPI00114D57AB|nr:hypothetical protein [Nocardia bhagyanarayanae]